MQTKILFSLALAAAALLSGCATRSTMSFSDETEKLTPTSKPIYLMTATVRNSLRATYQPRIQWVEVENTASAKAEDQRNFRMDSKGRIAEADSFVAGNSYAIRLALDNGKYIIRHLRCGTDTFPISGWFYVPVHGDVDAKEPGVYYLGHIDATVRERRGDEFKAGPAIPLIDQAIAGASIGTFDVEISDQFAKDEAMFRAKFPALANVEIKKAVLPAFDRDKAQKWWLAN